MQVKEFLKKNNYLILILLLGISVRFFLAKSGGQFFMVDEARYFIGYKLLSSLSDFDISSFIKTFLSSTHHILFNIFCLFSELLRYIYIKIFVNFGIAPYELNNLETGYFWISSFLFSLSSLVSAFIIYKIIYSFTENRFVSNLSFLIACLSNVSTYHSRHLVPYDITSMLCLLGLYMGLKKIKGGYFLSGFFCSTAILTYYGNLIVPLVYCIIISLYGSNDLRSIIKKSFIQIIGGLTPILCLFLMSLFIESQTFTKLLTSTEQVSGNQLGGYENFLADFFEYFFYSDNIIFIFLFSCFILFSKKFIDQDFLLSSFPKICYLGITLTFILMFFLNEFKILNLYGRGYKQLFPLLIIISAFTLLKFKKYIILLLIPFFAFNTYLLFNITFPFDVEKYLSYNQINYSSVSLLNGPSISAFENFRENEKLILINSQRQIPPILKKKKKFHGKIIEEWKHPYSYKPYQFIHYDQSSRDLIEKYSRKILLVEKIP